MGFENNLRHREISKVKKEAHYATIHSSNKVNLSKTSVSPLLILEPRTIEIDQKLQ